MPNSAVGTFSIYLVRLLAFLLILDGIVYEGTRPLA